MVDEDVEMTQTAINTKCPYTGKEMVVPMKNKICGHNYEKEGILQYIHQRKKKARYKTFIYSFFVVFIPRHTIVAWYYGLTLDVCVSIRQSYVHVFHFWMIT